MELFYCTLINTIIRYNFICDAILDINIQDIDLVMLPSQPAMRFLSVCVFWMLRALRFSQNLGRTWHA